MLWCKIKLFYSLLCAGMLDQEKGEERLDVLFHTLFSDPALSTSDPWLVSVALEYEILHTKRHM